MDKLHERKMNDLYKSPNGKCHEKFEFVKKFELVECRNRFYQCRKIDSIIVKFKHEKAFRFGV